MGTNYYMTTPERSVRCGHCGRESALQEEIHIGKASAGWAFLLHVTDELPDLESWVSYWNEHTPLIKDEYDEVISVQDMIEIITQRKWSDDWSERYYGRGVSEDSFHKQNGSERGVNNLLRVAGTDGPEGIPCCYKKGEFS